MIQSASRDTDSATNQILDKTVAQRIDIPDKEILFKILNEDTMIFQ